MARTTSRPGPALFVSAGNARFRPILIVQRAHLERLGYRTSYFDLGGLGFGRPFAVDDASFHAHGYYNRRDGWRTRALHKPAIVQLALAGLEVGQDLVYLDGDAICFAPVDELSAPAFDIGVTVRTAFDTSTNEVNARTMGRFNAGVIVFRKSPATEAFIARWAASTEALGNDQRALNTLLNPTYREVAAGETFVVEGVRIHGFDGLVYNNPEAFVATGIKVVHFKQRSWERHLANNGLPLPPTTRLQVQLELARRELARLHKTLDKRYQRARNALRRLFASSTRDRRGRRDRGRAPCDSRESRARASERRRDRRRSGSR